MQTNTIAYHGHYEYIMFLVQAPDPILRSANQGPKARTLTIAKPALSLTTMV